jgi:hypothetical protein
LFPEALTALAAFAQEATGQPARVGRPGTASAALTAPASRGPAARKAADDEPLAADEPADDPAGTVTLHLVSIARTERFQAANREVSRDPSGTGMAVRNGPGWYDLTVALEVGGDEIAAADALERLLSAGIRVGDLARSLGIESEYPVYALIDTPTEAELHTWWGAGLVRVPRAALKAVMTMAVQPFELAPVGIVRSRRLHTDDLRTRVRETVER